MIEACLNYKVGEISEDEFLLLGNPSASLGAEHIWFNLYDMAFTYRPTTQFVWKDLRVNIVSVDNFTHDGGKTSSLA